MTPDTIIVDIDGTLANNDHRQYYLEGPKKDWAGFFSEMSRDTVNRAVLQVVNSLAGDGYAIVLFTGRFEKYRDATQAWLAEHHIPYSLLLMRPDDDHRPDYELKRKMLQIYGRDRVLLTIDDRKQVVDMWREEGLTCFQVADHNF